MDKEELFIQHETDYDPEWHIKFKDGKLEFGNYSYHIAGYGKHELDDENTRRVYEKMKEYYGE